MEQPENNRGILDVALEIARKRRETLERMRAALLADDTVEAVELAKELCGLAHHEKSN